MISFTRMHDHTLFDPAVGTYDMTDLGFKQFTIISFQQDPKFSGWMWLRYIGIPTILLLMWSAQVVYNISF